MSSNETASWLLSRQPASDEQRKEHWRRLPSLPEWADPYPAGYDADEALLDAANTALCLGKPLLLTGEPGCGKTEFANHLAWRLGLERSYRDERARPRIEYALRFDTKSESRARDLFYMLDQVERFQAAQSTKGDIDPLHYMDFQALGRAVLYAAELGDLAQRLRPWQSHPGAPRRSVVLIDEIDKAPREFPNDLLMEVERMLFFIPELKRTVAADPGFRPIIVITSNSEKTLPDAFLRRCVYYNIAFPDDDRLRRIVAARLTQLPIDASLAGDAVVVFSCLHRLNLRKRPGTAELLDFVGALVAKGWKPDDRLVGNDRWRSEAERTLLKTKDDQTGVPWADIDKALDAARVSRAG